MLTSLSASCHAPSRLFRTHGEKPAINVNADLQKPRFNIRRTRTGRHQFHGHRYPKQFFRLPDIAAGIVGPPRTEKEGDRCEYIPCLSDDARGFAFEHSSVDRPPSLCGGRSVELALERILDRLYLQSRMAMSEEIVKDVKAPLGIVPRFVIRIRIGAEVSEPGTFEDEALDGEAGVRCFDPFDLSVGITAQDWLVSIMTSNSIT